MRTILRFAALALVGALVAPPVAAALACARMPAPAMTCCDPAGRDSQQPGPQLKTAPAEPACCEISSPPAAPREKATPGRELTRVAAGAPQVAGAAIPPVATAQASIKLPPARAVASSLHTLYCVFLI